MRIAEAVALVRGQGVLRTLAGCGPPAAMVASFPAGADPSTPFLLLVASLALAGALWTSSMLEPVALLLVLAWWVVRLDTAPTSPWVLAAAAALVAGHAAAVVADHGPVTLAVDPLLVRLWVRRGLLAFLAAPAAWLVARGLAAAPPQPGIWVAGLAAAAVAVLAASTLLARR